MSATSHDDNTPNFDEVLLPVSAELANGVPFGFTLDSGGSVMKIVYRSKHDYPDGKPIGGEDKLRLLFYPNTRIKNLLQFLKDNCDIRTPTSTDKIPTFYHTGLGIQHLADELESTFNCRVKLLSEMDMVAEGLATLPKHVPSMRQAIPFSLPKFEESLNNARTFIQCMQKQAEAGINAFGEGTLPQGADVLQYAMKLMTIDTKSLMDEMMNEPLTFPCLLVQCGSATAISVLYENGKYGKGTYSPVAAKTFLSLGRIVTGAKTPEELIEMASKGDWRKVDLTAGDLKLPDQNDTTWYSLMPDFMVMYSLGRLSEEKYDGQYSKEDLAAGLLHMQCQSLVRLVLEMGQLYKVKSVLFSGSFVQWPVARHLLEETFLPWSIVSPMLHKMTMHILPNSGFFTSLGAWYRNMNEHKNDEQ